MALLRVSGFRAAVRSSAADARALSTSLARIARLCTTGVLRESAAPEGSECSGNDTGTGTSRRACLTRLMHLLRTWSALRKRLARMKAYERRRL